jgi:deoxycytidine triphosphate deaminase
MVGDRLPPTPSIHETPESNGFWQDDVLRPIYNGAVASPLNALRTIAAPAIRAASGVDLPRVDELPVHKDDSLPGWVVQNVTSGVASLIPYLAAAKLTGGALRSAGAAAGLEGTAAKLATSDRFALVSGAAGYDFLRDDNPNGTTMRERFANAAGGAAAFYTFGVGNALVADAALSTKLVGRAVTGAAGADIQIAVSGLVAGKPIQFNDLKDAALSGGAMNLLLPFAQDRIASASDAINTRLGKGIPTARYIENENLAGRTDGLSEALEKAPFTRVQAGETANGTHTIAFDPSRQVELASKQAVAAGASPEQIADVSLNATAEHLRTQLLNQGLKEQKFVPSPVMTNDQIAAAMKEGRIKFEPPPKPGDFYENGVDVGLDSKFMKLPKGEHTDFSNPNAAKSALRRWANEGREMDYSAGITLAPGETALGFTDQTITLPRVPQRNADGTMEDWSGSPITANLNQKSSNARNFLTNHETAPALNNNSTAHKVVYEITNHSDNVVTLQPGIRFGSLQFHELGAFPAETERFKIGSVKGQTSLAGADSLDAQNLYIKQSMVPIDLTSGPSAARSPLMQALSLVDQHTNLNGPSLPFEAKNPSQNLIDYKSLPPWEQLRYRPDLQSAYAQALKAKSDPNNTLSDHELIQREAPSLVAQ